MANTTPRTCPACKSSLNPKLAIFEGWELGRCEKCGCTWYANRTKGGKMVRLDRKGVCDTFPADPLTRP